MKTLPERKSGNRESTVDPVDGDALAVALGDTLRRRRKDKGLTLQQLADLCGLSQPFLSQLENGKATPSLTALHQVAAALGTSAQQLLFPSTSTDFSLVRSDSARCYEVTRGATVCFLVEGANHQIGANLVTAEAGAESDRAFVHDGQELIHVLEGSVSVSLSDREVIELNAGDAYTYPATVPHEWRNIGKNTAKFLFVSTPPSF